jgi:predicted dehydrogenase
MSQPPVRIGVAGLGGFASYVTDRLLDQATLEWPSASFAAACDPDLSQLTRRANELRGHGASIVESFEELLALDIDAVWLPVPIDLHRPLTEAALAAGKAVLCEKPAAGCVDDVDAMIAARDRAKLPVLIGFQDLYQPNLAPLKRRLLNGDLGKVLGVTVIGCWPRGDAYFRRNAWVGRLQRDGRWIMDSPAANALAHFLHLPLYLLGSSMGEAATPLSVEAELYRANAIENYDTCSMRVIIEGNVPLIVGFTHACDTTIEPRVTIQTETSEIRYLAYRHI